LNVGEILEARLASLSAQSAGVGIAVELMSAAGPKFVAAGSLGSARRSPGRETVFEIGSVTKVFTALLLADMVTRGEVALADPVQRYLPAATMLPRRTGHPITLFDLATHRSGLPFMPDLPSGTSVSTRSLFQFVAHYEPPKTDRVEWEYSNLGYWLLSEALGYRAQLPFEELLRRRVLKPLKLVSTDFALSPSMQTRLAGGHDAGLQPAQAITSNSLYALMPAAGGLYSTVDDLMKLVAVTLGLRRSPLSRAAALAVSARVPLGGGDQQALGWTITRSASGPLIFRDGGTFGSASCIVCDPIRRLGVAVLANQVASVSDIARHILGPEFQLEHPTAVTEKEIALDSATLEDYVGRYAAPGEGTFQIVRQNDVLTLIAPAEWGLPDLQIHAASKSDFFAKELPLRITFQRGADGRVTGMLIYPPRGQKAVRATKMAD